MGKKRFLFDTNNFDDGVANVVAPVEEYVPPAPTYSEDELTAAIESAREESFKKGKHEGFLESEEGFSQKLLHICESLSKNVDDLFDRETARNEVFQNDSMSIIEACFSSALPDLMKQGDFESTLQFIEKQVSDYSHESTLTIEVEDAYIEPLQNYFKQNMEDNSNNIKFKSISTSKLDVLSEVNVSWSNGGATRKPEELKENIIKVLKLALAENSSAKHNDEDIVKDEMNKSETNDE